MAQLDKFKRRLIRSVARLRVEEKRPDKEVWEVLSKEMGCDCGPLWDRMRALTLKKLSRLLVCGDRTESIASVARPSDTDMLMFDLVLAHEDDVDVIGRDLIGEKTTDCDALQELLDLVQEFSLEETPADLLADTWAEAVRYYESKGSRLTSPMLLQRRWYQLKELTRANFYKLWQSWRGNTGLWEKAKSDCSLNDIQVAVAERYPHVITKPFQKWDELIKAGLVVLPHHFEQKAPEKSGSSGNEQDLVLLEPQVETIDLRVDSDSEAESGTEGDHPTDATDQPKSKQVLKQTNEDKTATLVEHDPNITIKTELPDSDGLSNVKILEATHIPIKPLDNTSPDTIKTENDLDPRMALKNDLLRNISKCIESTDELIRQCDPQEDESENLQNALNDVANQMERIIEPRSSVEVIEDEPAEPQTSNHNLNEVIQGKAFDYFRNKIVEEMRKASVDEEVTENAVQETGITDDKLSKSNVPEDNIEDSLSPEKENTPDHVISSEEEDLLEDIIKQTADDFVNKSKQSRTESGALTLTDLTIVDGGIDFVDDGIEYDEDDEDKTMEIDADNSSMEKQEDATPSIDLKLLMTPLVVTTRLDNMLAFKDREFESVIDRITIDLAELESKPKQVVKEPVKELEIEEENKSNDDVLDSDSSDDEDDAINDDQRVKPTSYLLQKPRTRSYNPIQLCKNPDFNTRLKRLTFGFLSSERNRQFLSACQPATIDLHKAFEDKLVNGTLYLKQSTRTDFIKESSVQKDDQSIQTSSVVPSAMSVQSLIDRSKINYQPPSAVSSVDLTSDDLTERNKVINLPDITQVRRINQKLLTAEVPPIRVQSDVTSTVASSYLEAQPVAENTMATKQQATTGNKETAEIGQELNNCNRTSQAIDKNNSPLLSNLLVHHRPPSFPKSAFNNLVTEESSPSLKVGSRMILNFPEKRIDRPLANFDKPPANHKPEKTARKQLTRSVYPRLSWHKPVVRNLPLDDFLITHDTLLKILAKARNQEFSYYMGNKNTANVIKKSQTDVKISKSKQEDNNKSKQEDNKKSKQEDNKKRKQEDNKKIEVTERPKNTQSVKTTKSKPRARTRKGIMKTICCWARAWVFKTKGQLLRLPKHMCPNALQCNCCCKSELPQTLLKQTVQNPDPIELSDEENDNNLKSVSNSIECVVQQSVHIPMPKLRVYSPDKHKHNFNKEATDFTLRPTSAQKDTPQENTLVGTVCECRTSESTLVDNTLQNVVIDDNSAPVADVQGEVSVITDDTVQHNSVNLEAPTEKPRIFVIPEANVTQMNANNPKFNVNPNFHVVSPAIKKITVPPLISSSVSKKMYVEAVYSKTSRNPSVNMSTQTMNVPLLQNLCIEPEGKIIKKPDIIPQKQLVVDGTRPFTTPSTIVNKKNEQLIHLKSSKLSSDNPIFLGKNKILLTTVKFPSNFESSQKENERKDTKVASKVVPTFPLPEGVEIVLQPNGELACMVKPGIELDSTQISILPSILEAVKQQINNQQPFVIGDVINLSDDENEQKDDKNKNTSETNQENAFKPLVAQTREVITSPGEQMRKTQTNVPINEENCQETNKELSQLKEMTALSKVYDSSEIHSNESERENISDNRKSDQGKTNICAVQDADILKSQICDNSPAKSDEKRDEDQLCIDKDITMIQTENNESEENKLIDKINSSTETEGEKKETQENNERSAVSRNLLSDLMEMSGISEEDMKTAPEANTPTLPAVINISPFNVANEINADGSLINQFPDLTPVTSVAQLKYACEHDGKFFKLDFDTGTLAPISVSIKKKSFTPCKLPSDTVEFAVKEKTTGSTYKIGIPSNLNAGFPVPSSTVTEETKSVVVRRFGRSNKTPVFSKPITILRHTRPDSILRNKLKNKTRAFKKPRKKIEERIEAKIDLVDSDAPMEEEYLINSESDDDNTADNSNFPRDRIPYRRMADSNTVTEISDDSSDDEPLALKSKRMRSEVSDPTQAVIETDKSISDEVEDHGQTEQGFLRKQQVYVQHLINEVVEAEVRPETEPTDADNMELDTNNMDLDTDNMELDTDMPTAAILEEPVLQPEEGGLSEPESSPEDSILGM